MCEVADRVFDAVRRQTLPHCPSVTIRKRQTPKTAAPDIPRVAGCLPPHRYAARQQTTRLLTKSRLYLDDSVLRTTSLPFTGYGKPGVLR